MIANTHDFFAFLSDSSPRVTQVRWHYYFDKLGHFSGYPILVVWAIGIAVALRIRNAGDRLLLAWVLVLAVFFQAYPFKAFNYLLPLMPPLSILGGRGLYSVAVWLGSLHEPEPAGRARSTDMASGASRPPRGGVRACGGVDRARHGCGADRLLFRAARGGQLAPRQH